MKAAELIVQYARELMGTPFLHQGRNPSIGVDCAGLVVHCLRKAGVSCTDVRGYGRNPDGVTMKAHLDGQANLRLIGAPTRGCIILFKIKHDPQHVGVWDGDEIIHSYSTAGKVTSNPMDEWWRDRIVSCYEVIE